MERDEQAESLLRAAGWRIHVLRALVAYRPNEGRTNEMAPASLSHPRSKFRTKASRFSARDATALVAAPRKRT